MKLATTTQGVARVEGDQVELLDLPYSDLGALLIEDPEMAVAASAAVSRTATTNEVELLAPVRRPGKLIVIGLNYHSHAAETGLDLPEDPAFFVVPGSAVVGPGDQIRLPGRAPSRVDYEGELAVVIGTAATEVAVGDAWDHVAGLTICNDVSARDVQALSMQGPAVDLAQAKSFDTFKPLGPVLVTRDQFAMPPDLEITVDVNGERRQHDRTNQLIHGIDEIISYVSGYMTLHPGDIISTGSPAGVGAVTKRFLSPGDEIAVSIEGIGTLVNQVGDRRS